MHRVSAHRPRLIAPIALTAQTELAAFLVAAGEHSYYMCSAWSGTEPVWYPVYDMKIGPPLANATLGPDKVWRRQFHHVSVRYDTKSEAGVIEWGGTTANAPRTQAFLY